MQNFFFSSTILIVESSEDFNKAAFLADNAPYYFTVC